MDEKKNADFEEVIIDDPKKLEEIAGGDGGQFPFPDIGPMCPMCYSKNWGVKLLKDEDGRLYSQYICRDCGTLYGRKKYNSTV